MKIIIRNLIYVFTRFRLAIILNLLGLSIAFATFMIIVMQVNYDRNFNKLIKESDCIFRVEAVHDNNFKQAVVSRPLAELLFQSSPHVVGGCYDQFFSKETFLSVTSNNGIKNNYKEQSQGVSPSYATVFSFEMLEGDRNALEDPSQVLIPESLARKFFGDESALGQRLDRERDSWVVGGVYKDFPDNVLVKNIVYSSIGDENINKWDNWNYHVYIKVDSPEAVIGLSENLKKAYPEDVKVVQSINLQFTSLPETYYIKDVAYDNLPKSSRETIAVLLAIGVIIVIIAGVNFTNFSMALTPTRIKSINTQKVLGATSAELRVLLIAEAVCISLFAYLISLLLVYLVSMTSLSDLLEANISLSENWVIVSITAIFSLSIGILSGVYPAFYMTSFPTALVLKGSFGLSPHGRKARNILIGIQFTTSMALIMGAVFMYLQNQYLQNGSNGYDKDVLIVSDMNDQTNEQWSVLKASLEALPGIEKTARSFALFSSEEQYMGWGCDYKETNISFECLPVDFDFLEVMGIKLTEGRDFMPNDTIRNAYIFNEIARKEFNLELNSEVRGTGFIIGFIPDVKYATFRTKTRPMAFYMSPGFLKELDYVYIRIRPGVNLHTTLDQVKSTFATLDSEYPFNIRFVDDVLNNTYQKERRLSSLITLFCAITIAISIVGVFGLAIFECEYRRKEIGIRRVLGSSVNEILLLFNKTYATILIVCFAIAVPVCYYTMTRWLENFAYHISLYWWVFVAGGILSLSIVTVTVSWQSLKAALANPVDSLKNE